MAHESLGETVRFLRAVEVEADSSIRSLVKRQEELSVLAREYPPGSADEFSEAVEGSMVALGVDQTLAHDRARRIAEALAEVDAERHNAAELLRSATGSQVRLTNRLIELRHRLGAVTPLVDDAQARRKFAANR